VADPEKKKRFWWPLLRWAAITVTTAGLTVVLNALGVPSGALFAGLLIGIGIALTARSPLVMHVQVNTAAQAVIGVVIGGLVDLSTLTALGLNWPSVIAVVLATLLLSVVAGILMGRWTSVSGNHRLAEHDRRRRGWGSVHEP
jgi:uncharacterized membrane protein AbrB (regulator of aidB expression)